jgi:hypothetical protein
MSLRSSFVAVAVIAGILAVAVSTLTSRAVFAQVPNIVIAVPAAEPVTIAGANDEGDVLLITGQPVGFTDGTGCVLFAGSFPVENAVVVDPGGNRATRLTNVIVTSQQTALKPGTKLVNVNAAGPCTLVDSGVAYNRYSATVQ